MILAATSSDSGMYTVLGFLMCFGVIGFMVWKSSTASGRDYTEREEQRKQAKIDRQLRSRPGGKVNAPISKVGVKAAGAQSARSADTKPCPFCAEEIRSAAVKCKHCGEFLTDSGATPSPTRASTAGTKKSTANEMGGTGGPAGLACPKCGGMQFTAKRSTRGKVIGFSTLGVGGLIAPKSMVKCVTCGTTFKRG